MYCGVIGIDVGKRTLECYAYPMKESTVVENNEAGWKSLLQWVDTQGENILICFEHTGLYSEQFGEYLMLHTRDHIAVPGLEIKRSLGISRGKDDKVDAQKIAQYAFRRREELQADVVRNPILTDIKKLLSLRDKLVRQRAGYSATLTEYGEFLSRDRQPLLFDVQEGMVNELNSNIEKIEKEIDRLIRSDKKLEILYDLITGIKGVGPQTALYMIVTTMAFSKFKNWRAFAAYCGIAPYPNRSGTSLRGKTKVSHLANKKLKSLLDMCAKSSIAHNEELRKYYNRRVESGKNTASTRNILRNKILSRIFAVATRKTPYVEICAYSAK